MELNAPDIFHDRWRTQAALAYGISGFALELLAIAVLVVGNHNRDFGLQGTPGDNEFGFGICAVVLLAPIAIGLGYAMVREHRTKDQSVESTGWTGRRLLLQLIGISLAWLIPLVLFLLAGIEASAL